VLEPKFSATRLAGQWAGSFGLLAVSAQRTAAPLVIAQLVEPVVGLLVGLAAELEISELGGHWTVDSQGTECTSLGRKEAGLHM
jgi:hypothetical protein